jgi:hypothetical protein
VLVYRDLKTTRSYEHGEPVPELAEGLYVIAVGPLLHARRAATIVVAHRTKRMEVLVRRRSCRNSDRSFDQPAPRPTLVMPSA